MKLKVALLAFLAAFSVGSVIVYFNVQRTVDRTVPVKLPSIFKVYPPVEMIDLEEQDFINNLNSLTQAKDYRALDDLGKELTEKKLRFKGGTWQIFLFDAFLSSPQSEVQDEAAWSDQIRFVQSWVKASPQSIFAKVALANSETGFGGFFRGETYAAAVPESAWPKYHEHLTKAKKALDEAASIQSKYVGYFEVKLNIARLDGVDKKAFDKVYDEAVTFEPRYEYFYKQKAHALLPQWGGQFGDSETFAERVKIKLGPVEGVKMYSVIIAELCRISRLDYIRSHRVSWPDVVKGFELREAEFGTNRLRLNEFAKLAVAKGDNKSYCEVFRRLDSADAFEPGIWTSRGEFNALQGSVDEACETAQTMAEIEAGNPGANNGFSGQ